MRLKDRVALVTGGGTGIGLAIAELFAREGARVAVSGRRHAELAQAVARVARGGGEACAVTGDVSNPEDAERMVEETVERFGKVDVLVNNAGILVRGARVTDVAIEDWRRVLETNLTGAFLVSRFAIRQMLAQGRGGAVVNISSVSGILGDAAFAPYNASKGGLNLLTKNMAIDYAKHGIRVNAVCPGRVDTPMPRSRMKPGDDWEEILARWGERIPLGRVGKPEDVASAALYLASDESSWVTGIELVVDGGVTMSHPPIG